MEKAELRKIYLERQKNLSFFDKKQKSEQIADRFFNEFDLSNARFLHCFIAIEKFNEIDTTLIFTRLWREFSNVQTLCPARKFSDQ